LNQGELEASIANYDLAIKIDPSLKAYGNRGLARMFQGNTTAAEKDFDECVRLDLELKPSLDEIIEKAKRAGQRIIASNHVGN
jgi:tetratricopeptide (TPR) repeat protein